MKLKAFLIGGLFFLQSGMNAQTLTPAQYIETYRDIAISEMRRSGIPAAITLAQGILESECGNSELSRSSNNHFGIKCKSNWNGEAVYHDDDATGECFRKYPSVEDSYRDHSDFLRTNGRYASLFEIDPHDYKAWCRGLKRAGYATNPRYPEILIRSIEKYQLQQYTLVGLNEPVDSTAWASGNQSADQPVFLHPAPPSDYFKKTKHNGLKAVYVPEGTSLLAIARKYRIPLGHFLDYNDLEEDGLTEADQWLYLQRKWKHGRKEEEKAEEGETLYDIAQRTGVVLACLLKYNQIDQQTPLNAGTRVFLTEPGKKANQKDNDVVIRIHLVQPKEGLYSISKKYNVSIQQLKDWNQLSSDQLKVGQKLIIAK